MRTLVRNRSPFYYCTYIGKTALTDSGGYKTGEYANTYSAPKVCYGNVSAAKGVAMVEQFGSNLDYDRVIILKNKDTDIDENSVLFLFVKPNEDRLNYDYIVKRVARSLNFTALAVSRVK